MSVESTTVRDPSGGVNQIGVRDHNERLVLSLIQRHGALASAEIARRTGLSAQTISVILRALEQDGLVEKGEPQRGKVGKPLTPLRLRRDGILSIGLKIGRRNGELILMDVAGTVRWRRAITYPYPLPGQMLEFLRDGLAEILAQLTPAERARLSGIGIAEPFQMWNWLETMRAAPSEMAAWRHVDFPAAIARFSDLPVVVSNDATAACGAEHLFGRGRQFADYAYFFLGFFAGGGVVLNDAVLAGRSGNAGAFGSLPVRDTGRPGHQLIHTASLHLLESALAGNGHDPMTLWEEGADWAAFEPHLSVWIGQCARHLAVAAVAVSAVIDFQAVLIDGAFPAVVRERLVRATRDHLPQIDMQGIEPPRLLAAAVGAQARVIGAASLPISERYLLSRPGPGAG